MKKINFKHAWLPMMLAITSLSAAAGEHGTIYTQGSTNGVGVGYARSVDKNFAIRGQLNGLNKTYTDNVGDFGPSSALNAEIKMRSVQLIGDWYPAADSWRISGGLILNNNKISLTGKGLVNGIPANVSGEIKPSDVISPYLGIGYSTRPRSAKGFGFNFDFGVMRQQPSVSLSAIGVGITQSDIDAQKRSMQNAADKFKVMPVLGLGVSYAF